jgi:hypothetical protein
MALQIIPSRKLPPVKHSLILGFAGIPQPRPLCPNGRVFRKLAGEVPAVYLENDELVEMTYEEAFTIRFMRWLPEAMQREFAGIFEQGIPLAEFEDRLKAFVPKLQAHKKQSPPPWQDEATTGGAA